MTTTEQPRSQHDDDDDEHSVGRLGLTRLRELSTELQTRRQLAREQVERARPRSSAVDTAMSTYERDADRGGELISGALAYRCFLWLLPLALVCVGALGAARHGSTSTQAWADRAGVLGMAGKSIAEAGTDASQSWWLAILVGMPALYLTSVSLVKAMNLAHARVWDIPSVRITKKVKAAVALNVGVLSVLVALGLEQRARSANRPLGVFLTLAFVVFVTGLWVVASWHLPHAVSSWHELVPGALLVAAGGQLVHLLTVYYVAAKLERASTTYGSIASATALLLSLYLLARVVVAGAALNAHLNVRRRRAHTSAAAD